MSRQVKTSFFYTAKNTNEHKIFKFSIFTFQAVIESNVENYSTIQLCVQSFIISADKMVFQSDKNYDDKNLNIFNV